MVEHGPLQLKVFFQKRHRFDLFGFALVPGVGFGEGGDLLDEPEVRGLGDVLVAVDFLLFVAPVWERLGVRPHCDLGRIVEEFEEAGHGAEVLVAFPVLELDLKEGVVVALAGRFFNLDSGEFLVCREPRGGDVVAEKVGVGYHMAELHDIAVLDGEVGYGFGGVFGEDDPVVVCVIEGVTGHLLAWTGLVVVHEVSPGYVPWEEILPSS